MPRSWNRINIGQGEIAMHRVRRQCCGQPALAPESPRSRPRIDTTRLDPSSFCRPNIGLRWQAQLLSGDVRLKRLIELVGYLIRQTALPRLQGIQCRLEITNTSQQRWRQRQAMTLQLKVIP